MVILNIENVVTLLFQANATLTCQKLRIFEAGTLILYSNLLKPSLPKSFGVSVPTSQPLCVAAAFLHLRDSVIFSLSSTFTAPLPSDASTPATTSFHQVLPETFLR